MCMYIYALLVFGIGLVAGFKCDFCHRVKECTKPRTKRVIELNEFTRCIPCSLSNPNGFVTKIIRTFSANGKLCGKIVATNEIIVICWNGEFGRCQILFTLTNTERRQTMKIF